MCKGSYAELEQQLKEEEEKKNGNEALSRRHMLLHDRISTLTAFSVPHVHFLFRTKAVAFVTQEHAGPPRNKRNHDSTANQETVRTSVCSRHGLLKHSHLNTALVLSIVLSLLPLAAKGPSKKKKKKKIRLDLSLNGASVKLSGLQVSVALTNSRCRTCQTSK